MTQRDARLDLKWELLPLFLITLSFALGFIFYHGRIYHKDPSGHQPFLKIAEERGPDGEVKGGVYAGEWQTMSACLEWGIPAAALGVYLLLTLGTWAVGRVADPVRDVNWLNRMAGRPTIDDPAEKERIRLKLMRGQYLCKVAFACVALVAQWRFFLAIAGKLGMVAL